MNIPVKRVSDKEMELAIEARFINLVTSVAGKYGCTVKDLDTTNRIIHFDGPDGKVEAMCAELCGVLDIYGFEEVTE